MQLEKNQTTTTSGQTVPKWAARIRAPQHPLDELQSVIQDCFGIDGHVKPLDGERDQNVLVSDGRAQRWVLKICEGPDAVATASFQAALLRHLEKTAPALPLPRNIATKNHEPFALRQFDNGQTGTVRLVTYLEGQPLSDKPNQDGAWAKNVGAFQGALCTVLRGFDHPQADRFLPWDVLSEVMLLPEMLVFLEPDFDDIIAPHLDRLRSVTLPALRSMPSQVIHNDMHPGNVLVDDHDQISGIIDFGDAIRRPCIQELAVSATSLIETCPACHEDMLADLINGFTSQCPIPTDQGAHLYDVVLLRSILSVALGRMKDQFVDPALRPRPVTLASEVGLLSVLKLQDSAVWRTRAPGIQECQ